MTTKPSAAPRLVFFDFDARVGRSDADKDIRIGPTPCLELTLLLNLDMGHSNFRTDATVRSRGVDFERMVSELSRAQARVLGL